MKATTMMASLVMLLITGCSTFDQMHVARKAVDAGFIEGINASNEFNAVIFCWPDVWGPYTDIDRIYGEMTNGPYSGHQIAFFLGKSRITKEWEVFSTLLWDNGKWNPLKITLPPCTNQSK